MKYAILILNKELIRMDEDEIRIKRMCQPFIIDDWVKRKDQITVAISILEKAENNTGS